jgi:trigger factor
LNIQTEQLEESHAARVTVDLEPERVKKAFEGAARRISQRTNIPGFRKGKAPYAVILKYFGTQGLLEESIESLADSIYKDVLKETGIQPYTMGSLDDIKMDKAEEGGEDAIPKLALVFTIPKQPEINLNDYREMRIPYEPQEVTEDQIDRTIRTIREGRATIEPSTEPVKIGDKVKVTLNGVLERRRMEYDLSDEEIEQDKAVEGAVETEPIDEEQEVILRTGADDEIMPGFSEQIVGMKDGETKEFTLDYADDSEFDEWANHTAKIKAEVSEIRTVTLPELNDEFANTISEGKYPTLAEYRAKIREDLQNELNRIVENDYATEALEALTEGADMAYPDVMVDEYVDDIVQELENNLREQNLSLQQFMALERLDMDKLRASYAQLAMDRLERSLALGKLVEAEKLTVNDADVDAAIDKMVEGLGEQAAIFRRMFDNPQSRTNIALDLIKDKALTRLTAIVKGENPPLPAETTREAVESPAETTLEANPAPAAEKTPETSAE